MSLTPRDDRRHQKMPKDQRNEFARDRDRILYCSAFKRLAGVTQVVSPSEGSIFHNRLTHSLKVAQVGRSIAENLAKNNDDERMGPIAPDVVEAACLAHDLGHPPFGHNGEKILNELINEEMKSNTSDGFEGNAQTFRIVTKLSKRSSEWPGLNLTKATLNALLKYPWLKTAEGEKSDKFNAYYSEKEDFDFARDGFSNDNKSAEATIMELADDITYSVHDVEDFYRAGLIPLNRILKLDEREVKKFLKETKDDWGKESLTEENAYNSLKSLSLIISPEIFSPYDGNTKQKAVLRSFTSMLIGRYVKGITINSNNQIHMDDTCDDEIRILKQLPKYYIFNHPNLSVQKYGQRRVLKFLFKALLDDEKIWPRHFKQLFQEINETDSNEESRIKTRFISDIIANMTEQEAYDLFLKLNGTRPGRISDLDVS